MKNAKSTVQILTLGDASILDLPKVGFLSSRKVRPAAVMKCYDWATEMRDKSVFAAIDPNGALPRLVGEYPDLQWRVLA